MGQPTVRQPAVAGLFYSADPAALRRNIQAYLAQARPPSVKPKALIVPHAGYIYSGPVAASAYALLAPRAADIRRVVLLGPSHYVPFRGLALPEAQRFDTPLGGIELDADAMRALGGLPQVRQFDAAHAREHGLEVQLPFLQVALRRFALVPLAVGDALPEETAEVLERLWGGDETIVVVSSDLSHYNAYEAALLLDRETADAIERLDGRFIDGERACGCHPIRGLLHLARRKNLRAVTLDRRNSGDTAGDRDRDRVVGYGAWAFAEAA